MGKEAQKQKRAITEGEIEVPGKASWVLRYLGPLLHHTLNNSAERTARKEAMRKKFYSMGGAIHRQEGHINIKNCGDRNQWMDLFLPPEH